MDCPKCPGSALAARQDNMLLELDRCAKCGGVWFDKQELYARIREPMKFFAAFSQAYQDAAKTAFLCPRDQAPMLQATIQDIALPFEACGACGGMWFDQGEVEKLNEFLKSWDSSSK